jgi:SOS-response transcriptional repressor LexA
LPRAGVGNKLPLLLLRRGSAATFIALLSSFALDYSARQKLGGASINYFVLQQLPVPDPSAFDRRAPWGAGETLDEWIRDRVLELVYVAWDMHEFAQDHGWDGPPFQWDPDRRFLLRCELDAAFFHLYGLDRAEVAYVLETFHVVRRRDEQEHGAFRTKDTVLRIFDAMADAAATGHALATVVDPPPADPSVAHVSDELPSREARVLQFPFRRLPAPPTGVAAASFAPIYSLRAAAGAFGDGEAVEPDGWAELNGHSSIRPGTFVAQVRGRSMEPRIPDGAWCLFTAPVEGSRDGRILLVEHRAIDDPENGGSYTVKRYRSRKRAVEGELWEHEEIVLEPLNPEYEPIVLRDVEEAEFRVVAELVEVLG